jgi:glycosyltransferase involved in cell wall biosynthesis
MSQSCEITAVIPTYNRAGLIARAIESVLDQTAKPGQVIVVDDGSIDNTAVVCKAYARWVQYAWQPNAGPSASRNAGSRLAGHRWVAFLDSDDYWTPSHLERMTAAIGETAGEAAFYFSDMQMPELNGGGTLWGKIEFCPRAPLHLVRDASEWVLMKRQPTMLQSSVISKRALESVGGLAERFRLTHDSYLFCQLGIGGIACAVSGIGCVQTSEDCSNVRLTVDIPFGSQRHLTESCELWQNVLDRQKTLPTYFRRLVTNNLAASHLGLGKAMWHSRRRIGAIWHLILTAASDPNLAAWLIRNGSVKGYDETVRRLCSEQAPKEQPSACDAGGR